MNWYEWNKSTANFVRRRLLEVIDVTDPEYGAVGNGIEDDTAAIQAAIDAAVQIGSRVLFPAGVYRVTSELQIGDPDITHATLFDTTFDPAANYSVNTSVRNANTAAYLNIQMIGIGEVVIWGDFSPSTLTPIIGYYLGTTENHTAEQGAGVLNGAIKNIGVVGKNCVSSGVVLKRGTDAGFGAINRANKQIGIYAYYGAQVVDQCWVQGLQVGIGRVGAYWTNTEHTVAWDCGTAHFLRDCNASSCMNNVAWYSDYGLIISGGAYQVGAYHTEQVREDMWIKSADAAVIGPCYLEDIESGFGDGSGKFAVTFGTTENGLEVVNSTFMGLRVGSVRTGKQGYRVWSCRSVTFQSCREYATGHVFDANSYGCVINCDGDFIPPFGDGYLWTMIEGGTLRIPVVATANLFSASSTHDGRFFIEDAGAGDRNLILYAEGQRFRIDGGAAF